MKIIQENEYLDTMKNEVEPYLKAPLPRGVHSRSRRHLPWEKWNYGKNPCEALSGR